MAHIEYASSRANSIVFSHSSTGIFDWHLVPSERTHFCATRDMGII